MQNKRISRGSVWEYKYKYHDGRASIEPFVVVMLDKTHAYGASYFSAKPRTIRCDTLKINFERVANDKERAAQLAGSPAWAIRTPYQPGVKRIRRPRLTDSDPPIPSRESVLRVSVLEYSALTGLSGSAVRHRCERGALDGVKVHGKWMVSIPPTEPKASLPRRTVIKPVKVAAPPPAKIGFWAKIISFFKGAK